jgi:DNA-binding SARP family transcriptional activator
VWQFESIYSAVEDTPGQTLCEGDAERVREALDLYRGDLLEGCYQDWCILERERLRQAYLALIEKQMTYCESRGRYEAAVELGIRALRCEVAHERIHRRLMRLHYLAGDRTAALRQYQRCVAVLQQELSVAPSPLTLALYHRIQAGRSAYPDRPQPRRKTDGLEETQTTSTPTTPSLRSLQSMLVQIQQQLQEAAQMVDRALSRQG